MQPPFEKQLGGRIRESIGGKVDPAGPEKDSLESEIIAAMMAYWKEQQERIIKRISPKVPKDRKAIEDVPALLNDPDFWADEINSLLMVLLPLISKGAQAGVALHAASVESLGIAVDWTMPYTEAAEWARKHCGKLVTQVSQTTRQRIGAEVANWIESGEPLPKLVQRLQAEEYGFSRKRAELIAQTETTTAFGGGELTAARAIETQGFFAYEKQWETVRDELVCAICEPLQYNGKNAVPGVDGWFETPIGALQGPAAHPGCRCWVNIVPVQVA